MTPYLPYVLKNALLSVPPVRERYRRRLVQRGYDPRKNDASYPLGVFRKHSAVLGNFAGADVLEIGPGGNLAVALRFLLGGARSVTAIDIVPYAESSLDVLYDNIAIDAGCPGEGGRVREIRYLSPVDAARTSLADRSFDIIYSHACFEHFSEPGDVIEEIRRVLRFGGRTSHQIDLADHRDKRTPLDFLRYSSRAWRLACSNGGNWSTNRWRAGQFAREFSNGFVVTHRTVTDRTEVSATTRASLHVDFAGLSDDDLSAIGLLIAAKRV